MTVATCCCPTWGCPLHHSVSLAGSRTASQHGCERRAEVVRKIADEIDNFVCLDDYPFGPEEVAESIVAALERMGVRL